MQDGLIKLIHRAQTRGGDEHRVAARGEPGREVGTECGLSDSTITRDENDAGSVAEAVFGLSARDDEGYDTDVPLPRLRGERTCAERIAGFVHGIRLLKG
jgi:hypothetical protein